MNYLFEEENDGRLSFLDINIFWEKGKFITNVYQKKTFSGVYTDFKASQLKPIKAVLIKSLLSQYFSLCFDFVKFHHEINILKSIVYKNS